MTEVYNYFAMPPARRDFCAAALDVANAYLAAAPENFSLFAVNGLQRYEQAFEAFFSAYEDYEVQSAAWDVRYGTEYGRSQPGWVAIYGNTLQQQNAGVTAQGFAPDALVSVPGDESGAVIPIIPVDEGSVSTPVVQPIPGEDIVVPPTASGSDEG